MVEGTFPVVISATNGISPDDSQVYSITVSLPRVSAFFDDFESSSGWQTNPAGSDTATTGLWERANPQGTATGLGNIQLGTTVSGSFDLVTDGSGGSAGANDVDGGTTSSRSPAINLASDLTDAQLSFWYYFADVLNTSSDDFFRVSVIGTSSSQTALEILGTGNDRAAAWTQHTVDISSFIGDTIRILVEANDSGAGSYVESALDDVSITAMDPTPENQAPEVEAGNPQAVNFDFPTVSQVQVNLDGTVTDDFLPTPLNLTTGWTVTGGNPANVSLGDASQVDTTATFTAGGVYTLTLSADDSELQNSDDVVITVNRAPVVDAGSRQIITLPTPNFVNLDSTVTDDGLPTPPNLTTQWAVISGNGANVTFGNDTQQDTTATFSTDGTYTFRITADDGLFTPLPFDNVTIVVFPPLGGNQPPQVSIITGNKTIIMPAVNSVAIDGNVTDDDLPDPPNLTISWGVSSGDATKVSFNPNDAADTIATFSAPGVYTLRLTASDGEEAPFAEITVTVNGITKEDAAAVLVPILDLLDD